MRLIWKIFPYICIEKRKRTSILGQFFFLKGTLFWDGGSTVYYFFFVLNNKAVASFYKEEKIIFQINDQIKSFHYYRNYKKSKFIYYNQIK